MESVADIAPLIQPELLSVHFRVYLVSVYVSRSLHQNMLHYLCSPYNHRIYAKCINLSVVLANVHFFSLYFVAVAILASFSHSMWCLCFIRSLVRFSSLLFVERLSSVSCFYLRRTIKRRNWKPSETNQRNRNKNKWKNRILVQSISIPN